MLFLLFGSSAAGKTFVLDALRGRVADLVIHDFDEIGVPPGADTAWRHRANEQWVRRALDYRPREPTYAFRRLELLGRLLNCQTLPAVGRHAS